MYPNDVKELLQSSVTELTLPITVSELCKVVHEQSLLLKQEQRRRHLK